jgi:hypothetical protein
MRAIMAGCRLGGWRREESMGDGRESESRGPDKQHQERGDGVDGEDETMDRGSQRRGDRFD